MGVYYSLLCYKGKKVYVVDIGSSISEDVDRFWHEMVSYYVEAIDRNLERVDECIEDKSIYEMSVSCFGKIVHIVSELLSLKYENDATTYGDLERTLAIWGFIKTMKCDRFEVVSDINLDDELERLRNEGYEVVRLDE